MICEYTAKTYCNESLSLIENYDKAIADSNTMWECHHRKEITTSRKKLIEIGEYYNRPSSELIFLKQKEHRALHAYRQFKGKKCKPFTEEHKQKMSTAQKGKRYSDETKKKLSESLKGNKNRLGTCHTDEARKKMSASHKGKMFTEEHKQKISEALKYKTTGRCWFNNGLINIKAKSCPEGFVRGRIKKSV